MAEVFDLAKNAPIFALVGTVMFLIGFFSRGNAKKNVAIGVFSMFFRTIGTILLLIAVSYWITTGISDWMEYSNRML